MYYVEQELWVLLRALHIHPHWTPFCARHLSRKHSGFSENCHPTFPVFESGTLQESITGNLGCLHAKLPLHFRE
jgi:hypothetical protein